MHGVEPAPTNRTVGVHLGPVWADEACRHDLLNVKGQRQRHHVSGEAVNHCARLAQEKGGTLRDRT